MESTPRSDSVRPGNNDEKSLRYLVYSDLYRYYGRASFGLLLRELLLGTSFKCTFWMRVRGWMLRRSALWLPARAVAWWLHRRCTIRYGVSLDPRMEVGPGFLVSHFGSLVINTRTKIGRNCNLAEGVTIGQSNRGSRQGVPIIGDNVYIGPGARIFGGITIGGDVAIGANCVVTHDVPDHAVVVGVPGRIISQEGSAGYINWTDYDGKF